MNEDTEDRKLSNDELAAAIVVANAMATCGTVNSKHAPCNRHLEFLLLEQQRRADTSD